jgi:RsiW-degrading membrane proteinase PrsW (M82 family)
MNEALIRAAALILAWGFSGAVVYLLLALADGWASRAALSKGAVLALLSIVLALPCAILLEIAAHRFEGPLAGAAARAFLSAALCEESGRLIALLILLRMTITRDPREFLMGVVAVGLGFGTVENLLYLQKSNAPLMLGALRGILTAPAHLSFALLSGLGVWRYRREGASFAFFALMFALAILSHGVYDFAAMAWPDPEKWSASALPSLVLLGLGVLTVAAVAAQALGSLIVVDAFLWRIEEAPPHDPGAAARQPLSRGWDAFGWALALAGVLLGVGALSATLFARSAVLPYLPIALAAAVSAGVWGFGVAQLANRQREVRRGRQAFAWRDAAISGAARMRQ